MANTLNLGTDGNWATKKDSLLAYNDENNNFKPLPFEFERASSATVVNKDGLIETVGSGEPRIDFKDDANGALLLEPSRTNLITYSEDFSNAYWSKSRITVSANNIISPDGTLNADKIIETTDTGLHAVSRTFTVVSGVSHTVSVFIKKGTNKFVQILFGTNNVTNNPYVNFDVNQGVFENNGTTSVDIKYFGNGWYRCSATVTTASTSLTYFISPIQSISDSRASSFTGSVNNNIYIYGAQIEEGSYATSYIPTSGSAVTRVAESSSQIVPDSAIGQTEGTVFLDFKPQALDGASRYLSIENSSSSGGGWMGVFASLVSGTIIFRFYGDGWDINSSLMIEKGTRYKIAFSYKNGVQTSIYVNGNLLNNITASLSGKSYQKIRLSEGATSFGDRGYADFNDIKLYDTIKTDNELQKLTTI